jgi:hypothetical protein
VELQQEESLTSLLSHPHFVVDFPSLSSTKTHSSVDLENTGLDSGLDLDLASRLDLETSSSIILTALLT